jgi:hypothetical protein
MESILGIVSGDISGAVLVFLCKGWISERLKQSIQHKYSEKLETYKTDCACFFAYSDPNPL